MPFVDQPRSPAPLSHPPFAVTGRVVLPDRVVDDGAVTVREGRITWVGPRREANAEDARLIADATPAGPGGYVLPGLVDLHCHGGAGVSFPDAADASEARTAVREHLRHGTTSLVASLVTAAPETLVRQTAILADLADAGEVAGIHLEGPFVSAARCGAQDPVFIQAPNPALVREAARVARGHLATMTIAPEIPGNTGPGGVAQTLWEVGAVPSFGHTDASACVAAAAIAEAFEAAPSGRRSARPTVTHLFNGCRPFHHRDPGPTLEFLAAARQGRAVVELIADTIHLHPATVAEVFALVGPGAIALVTDAMAATGMADGQYVLGSAAVTVSGGVARLTHGDSIAGGTSHLLDIVRHTVQDSAVPVSDAVASASLTPATVLGQPTQMGSLTPGVRADIVLTDADLQPLAVYREGFAVT